MKSMRAAFRARAHSQTFEGKLSQPFVSVLIDAYNHEKFIEQAIVSVLEQDFAASDYEILAVDDGSNDSSPEIIKKFAPRVVHLTKKNGGQGSAFNYGIPRCRGGIVAFLDADDWWEPNKLSTVVTEFESYPETGAIGHGLYEVDENGNRLFLNVPDRTYSCHLRDLAEARQFLELRSFLGTSRLAVRKSVLDKILPLPEAMLIEADEFLATHAVALSGCRVLDRPLTSYRFHSGNQFQSSAPDSRKLERKFISIDCLAKDLPPRLRTAGIASEIVEFLTLPNQIDATRLRLSLGRGWPWETVSVERKAFRIAYQNATFGYRLFHAAVLCAASVTPPRFFYKSRNAYAARRLSQLRDVVGEPIPTDSLVIRKAWP
jgi:glycosyltransferase involved in cell wall biosynthesis